MTTSSIVYGGLVLLFLAVIVPAIAAEIFLAFHEWLRGKKGGEE